MTTINVIKSNTNNGVKIKVARKTTFCGGVYYGPLYSVNVYENDQLQWGKTFIRKDDAHMFAIAAYSAHGDYRKAMWEYEGLTW